ncbi:MAG TPA: NAD-dependent epimerase/dehydratase family protein [Candidatus Aenigmarchaeota archaeon]|nr:MAG: hypothetical protein DRP03_00850 [Candidatus Aenigmarchaeota archaeon]HDD46091.1 NAD-dependent epimerase/dehydratase family protein [Candidatus Aenigmarchaeota archaeon]
MILISGVAGFIGSNLAGKLLEKGNVIVGIDNFDPYYSKEIKKENIAHLSKSKNFIFYEGDIRNERFLRKVFKEHSIEAVIHIAARAGVRASIKDPYLYNDVNINGTLNLLCAAVGSVKKFIYASSSSVYGNPIYLPIDEKHPTNPISPYGITKLAGEKYCLFFDKTYGLKSTCLRFFTVYGPGQRPDEAIHKFTRLAFEDKPIKIYGDGNQTRDFTYIDDIVSGTILALNKNIHGEVFNLGYGKRISVNELVDLIERYSGKRIKREYVDKAAGDVSDTWANIEKAKEMLGYEPKISIEEGVKKFIEWFKIKSKNKKL